MKQRNFSRQNLYLRTSAEVVNVLVNSNFGYFQNITGFVVVKIQFKFCRLLYHHSQLQLKRWKTSIFHSHSLSSEHYHCLIHSIPVFCRRIHITCIHASGRSKLVETEYQSFGIIYQTEPNNTESHIIQIFQSSNLSSNFETFSVLKSYSTITVEIFEWSMLLSRETSLITEFFLEKYFC